MKRGARTNIQIRGATPELLGKLRARAEKSGKSMSQYAIELLEKDLAYPSIAEWLDEIRRNPIPVHGSMTGAQAVREAREERAEQLARGAEKRWKRNARS